MIYSIHCVRRFAPALPLRGTSLREDGLHEATDAVLTDHNNQPISTVWTSIRNPSRLYLNNHCDLSKVQGQLIPRHNSSLRWYRAKLEITGIVSRTQHFGKQLPDQG